VGSGRVRVGGSAILLPAWVLAHVPSLGANLGTSPGREALRLRRDFWLTLGLLNVCCRDCLLVSYNLETSIHVMEIAKVLQMVLSSYDN